MQSATGPKLTTITNGLVPRLVRHKQNTEGNHCIVKELDKLRLSLFGLSPKVNSKKDLNYAIETENQFMDSILTSSKPRGVFASGPYSVILSRKRFEIVNVGFIWPKRTLPGSVICTIDRTAYVPSVHGHFDALEKLMSRMLLSAHYSASTVENKGALQPY